jgi:hypothetical protein
MTNGNDPGPSHHHQHHHQHPQHPPPPTSVSHPGYYPSRRESMSGMTPHPTYRHPSPPSNDNSYRHPHASAEQLRPLSSPSLVARERSSTHRYSPYVTHSPYPPPPPRRLSPNQLSLEIPSLSLRERSGPSSAGGAGGSGSGGGGPSSAVMETRITLPPLQAPSQHSLSSSGSSYALPPISAMEDMRGIHATDSAAVLRRLREDDDGPPPPSSYRNGYHEVDASAVKRQRSFSYKPYR